MSFTQPSDEVHVSDEARTPWPPRGPSLRMRLADSPWPYALLVVLVLLGAFALGAVAGAANAPTSPVQLGERDSFTDEHGRACTSVAGAGTDCDWLPVEQRFLDGLVP